MRTAIYTANIVIDKATKIYGVIKGERKYLGKASMNGTVEVEGTSMRQVSRRLKRYARREFPFGSRLGYLEFIEIRPSNYDGIKNESNETITTIAS